MHQADQTEQTLLKTLHNETCLYQLLTKGHETLHPLIYYTQYRHQARFFDYNKSHSLED